MLRDYQQETHDVVIQWVRKTISPAVVELATGAGKSHIIAAIAATIHKMTSKRVLCLAPRAELVKQNIAKYLATGNRASVFSAGAGGKCLRHPVVFGTPGTVKNRISRFGADFAMVIIDEAHGLTPTLFSILDAMRAANPNLRIIGLTATPYRMGTGYIYATEPDGRPVPEGSADSPFFVRLLHRVPARILIDRGYLTEPVAGAVGDHYDTAGMLLNSRGQFDADDVDRAFHGHGRKTSRIIAEIVAKAQNRRAVMIFAATVQHAGECMASLPPQLSAIVTGKTSHKEREKIYASFVDGRIKYLVNVDMLTTGFDAPQVDTIAILRATESVGLLQQIIGRGLRLYDGKADCLVLDYAENIERHCPDGDLFSPVVRATMQVESSGIIKALCPVCETENFFGARKNPDGYDHDKHGYFVDLDKNPIMGESGPIPAHHGRRCTGHIQPVGSAEWERCGYRWTCKDCPACGEDNDIAARYCHACKAEIIDPNEKLIKEFKALKRDPTREQTDELLSFDEVTTISTRGNKTRRVDWVTPYRTFSTWYSADPQNQWQQRQVDTLNAAIAAGIRSVTYKKDPDSGFYKIIAFNRSIDEVPALYQNIWKHQLPWPVPG